MSSCLQLTSEDDRLFYLESDALAVRANADYSRVLKTLVLLEAQRAQACADLETLIAKKDEALADPHSFVAKLRNVANAHADDDVLPQRQSVYVLPELDWERYYRCVDVDDLETMRAHSQQRTHSLRQTMRLIQSKQNTTTTNNNDDPDSTSATTGRVRRAAASKATAASSSASASSSRNHNKPWSVDEQRRLEELLLEYPPEDNEAARWRKIAAKLATRSHLQVQSHCQKYFIKLAKAGLPIPGRMPNLKTYVTKKGNRGNRKSSLMRGACMVAAGGGGQMADTTLAAAASRRMVGRGTCLNEISSMWSSFNPPVVMNDDDDDDDDEDDDEDDNGDYDYNEEEEEEEEAEGGDEEWAEEEYAEQQQQQQQQQQTSEYGQFDAADGDEDEHEGVEQARGGGGQQHVEMHNSSSPSLFIAAHHQLGVDDADGDGDMFDTTYTNASNSNSFNNNWPYNF